MDEYIKREDAIKAIIEHPSKIGVFTAKAIGAIESLPAADVVPKSEVDEIVRQWKEEANCWQNNYIAELCDDEQIKKEVAREIFEEFDKLTQIRESYPHIMTFNLKGYAELKRRYTEALSGEE